MSQTNKSFVIINGSPKTTPNSVSGGLAEHAANLFSNLGAHAETVRIRSSLSQEAGGGSFAAMRSADALLLIFPLYYFCVPSMLMQFLEDYAEYLLREGRPLPDQKVYAIVNCGFPEPDINEEAVRVIKSFAHQISATFRFGVRIGSGGMITEAREAPFMKKAIAQLDTALMQMAQDTAEAPAEDVSISVSFPRKLYFLMGNRGWYGMARKNNLKKKTLYARPYQTI
jgi:multimeric flavodoxin WrbA